MTPIYISLRIYAVDLDTLGHEAIDTPLLNLARNREVVVELERSSSDCRRTFAKRGRVRNINRACVEGNGPAPSLLHQDASRAAAESTAGIVECLHNRSTFIFPTPLCATISATSGGQPRTRKYKDSDLSIIIPSSFEKTKWQCKSNYASATAIPVT